MKNFILLVLVVCALSSCTKTKTVTVTKNIHDTTTIIIHHTDTSFILASFIGNWSPIDPASQTISFTLDSVSWSGFTPYRYTFSGDTLFRVYPNLEIDAMFYYYFSVNFDTLVFKELPPYTKVYHYVRG